VRRFVLVLVAAAVIAAEPAGTGAGAPSRIVDRTFVCTPVATYGGLRDLNLDAWPPRDSSGVRFAAYIAARSGPFGPGAELAIVRARSQAFIRPWESAPGVYSAARRCVAKRVSVPLTPRGLPGPPVLWGKEAECAIRGRVLVRVRAVLQSPASWRERADRWGYVGVRGNVVEAALAVRSERTRKPIALIELDRAGKTRLWVAPGCN
jgi:hypothetical protein